MLSLKQDYKTTVIIAAHPDDEVLGCGGTAAKLAQSGMRVVPVIVCENASVRYQGDMQNNLESWCRACAQVLGIEEPRFLQLPDQKLDTFSALEMAQHIEKAIRDIEPEVIFTHHGGDINKDHQVLYEASMVATRPLPNQRVRQVYTYETISSSEWGIDGFHSRFTPNTFVDINDTLAAKIEGFSKYESEIRTYPTSARSPRGIEIRAQDWGTRVGLLAAEPFQLIRQFA